jgi:hypothetical protein
LPDLDAFADSAAHADAVRASYVQAGVLNATDKLYRTMRADYTFGGVV